MREWGPARTPFRGAVHPLFMRIIPAARTDLREGTAAQLHPDRPRDPAGLVSGQGCEVRSTWRASHLGGSRAGSVASRRAGFPPAWCLCQRLILHLIRLYQPQGLRPGRRGRAPVPEARKHVSPRCTPHGYGGTRSSHHRPGRAAAFAGHPRRVQHAGRSARHCQCAPASSRNRAGAPGFSVWFAGQLRVRAPAVHRAAVPFGGGDPARGVLPVALCGLVRRDRTGFRVVPRSERLCDRDSPASSSSP
jgi:hypothetical protein